MDLVKKRTDRKSLAFIAPELFDENPVTKKADTYSIGAMYYYMLYGKEPSKEKLTFPKSV
jgi:serine/threonine protein kinase